MTSLYKLILLMIFASLIILFEVYSRKYATRRIYERIAFRGGELERISTVSFRERIYNIEYVLDGKYISETVKFSLFLNEEWY